MESIYTFKERRWLYLQTKTLTGNDTNYIFHVIRKNNEDYTVNSNGMFFDMERLSDESIQELMVYYKLLKRLEE
jgi:hypothetical protein